MIFIGAKTNKGENHRVRLHYMNHSFGSNN